VGLLTLLFGDGIKNERAWKDLASSIGLTVRRDLRGLRHIDGTIRGLHVTVERDEVRRDWTRVQIAGPVDQRLSATFRAAGPGDVAVGDPAFDDRLELQGPELTLRAAMDQATRAELRRLMSEGVTLEKGVLSCAVRGRLARNPREFFGEADEPALAARIQHMLAVMARLQIAPNRIPESLAHNAKADPVAGVRLKNLRVLADHFAAGAETQEAALAALEDSDLAVRIAGAVMLGGNAGRATLEAIASSDADDALRAGAWAVLAKWGAPGAERALLQFAESGSPAARVAAVRALGESGSIDAVAPLLEHAKGLLGEVHEAARDAVKAIQARQGHAGAGQLSVASSGATGGLSLTPAGGDLAVAPVDDNVAGERDTTGAMDPTRVKE
jgi:hypothetical protein